jgi:hypothetical protein
LRLGQRAARLERGALTPDMVNSPPLAFAFASAARSRDSAGLWEKKGLRAKPLSMPVIKVYWPGQTVLFALCRSSQLLTDVLRGAPK